MTIRMLGAIVLCLGASGIGFSASRTVRRTVKTMQQLKLALEMMRCEISYTLTPIARICRIAASGSEGEVHILFERLAAVFSGTYPEQDGWAKELIAATLHSVPPEVAETMAELIASFGRFGVSEQLRLIDLTLEKVQAALAQLDTDKKQRCRCYETLGICAGLAIAVLVL